MVRKTSRGLGVAVRSRILLLAVLAATAWVAAPVADQPSVLEKGKPAESERVAKLGPRGPGGGCRRDSRSALTRARAVHAGNAAAPLSLHR